MTGRGSLVGAGVTIYNAPGGPKDGINLSAGGLVALSPAPAGPYRGITIFQDPSSAAPIYVTGQGLVALAGTLYAPGATLNIGGQGSLVMGRDPFGSAVPHLIVADLDVSGQGSLYVDMAGVNPALVAAVAASQGSGDGADIPGVVVGQPDDQGGDGNGNGNGNAKGKGKKAGGD